MKGIAIESAFVGADMRLPQQHACRRKIRDGGRAYGEIPEIPEADGVRESDMSDCRHGHRFPFRHLNSSSAEAFTAQRRGALFARVHPVASPSPQALHATEQSERYANALATLLVEFGAGWVQKKPWILGAHKGVMLLILLLAA